MLHEEVHEDPHLLPSQLGTVEAVEFKEPHPVVIAIVTTHGVAIHLRPHMQHQIHNLRHSLELHTQRIQIPEAVLQHLSGVDLTTLHGTAHHAGDVLHQDQTALLTQEAVIALVVRLSAIQRLQAFVLGSDPPLVAKVRCGGGNARVLTININYNHIQTLHNYSFLMFFCSSV